MTIRARRQLLASFRPIALRAAFSAIVVSFSNARLLATSYVCGSVASRFVGAEAVVVGRTISEDQGQLDSSRAETVYEFRVDEILKGDQFRVGSIHKEASAYSPMGQTTHLPPKKWGPFVLFMFRGVDGSLRASPCKVPANESEMPNYRRMAEVAARPEDFLESADPTDVEVILCSIQRQHAPRSFLPPSSTPPAPSIDRATAVEFLHRQIDLRSGELYALAVRILAEFPTAASFDRLARALESDDPQVILAAARGLARLKDPRARRMLVGRFRAALDASGVAVEREVDGVDADGEPCRRRVSEQDRTYDSINQGLVTALEGLEDRDGLFELLGIVKPPMCFYVGQALAHLGDERAARTLLDCAWGGHGAAEPLIRLSDPRILKEARARQYDHPLAPTILAGKGDPQAREFMVRLIRQGHEDGARWAAATRDPSLRDLLVKALPQDGIYPAGMTMYALGRLRSLDLLPIILQRSSSPSAVQIERTYFALGLVDNDLASSAATDDDDFEAMLRRELKRTAAREHWTQADRRLAGRLVEDLEMERQPVSPSDLFQAFNFAPPPDQVRRMAFEVDFAAARQALGYIGAHPLSEYSPIVVEVLRRGRHLFDPQLYKAIQATHSTDCIELLRPLLTEQHIDIRRRAAIALANLGDHSGLGVLEQERQRLQPSASERCEVITAIQAIR